MHTKNKAAGVDTLPAELLKVNITAYIFYYKYTCFVAFEKLAPYLPKERKVSSRNYKRRENLQYIYVTTLEVSDLSVVKSFTKD